MLCVSDALRVWWDVEVGARLCACRERMSEALRVFGLWVGLCPNGGGIDRFPWVACASVRRTNTIVWEGFGVFCADLPAENV